MMTDEELLSATGKGDRRAFRELYDRQAPALLGFIRRQVGFNPSAEELFQEVMMRIWTRAPLFDPAKGRARSWMFTMAARLVLNHQQSRGVRQDRQTTIIDPEILAATATEPAPGPEAQAMAGCETEQVRRALACLPPELRLAIELRHLEHLGIAEIAAAMDCPEGTVKSRIFLGLKRLRQLLAREDSR
jgi:RNA polymerase sigma-70 factor, ECF subfamily